MRGRTGGDGLTEFPAVPDAPVRLLARATDGGWAERWIESPASARSPIDLVLEAGRVLTVDVVEDGTGRALPGCALRVLRADRTEWEEAGSPAVTGADGAATLAGLPREDVFVNAVTPAWTWPLGVQPEALATATATKHRLVVPRASVFVWTIGAGDGSAPSEGETTAIRSYDRITDFGGVVEPVGRIDNGTLRVEVRYPTHLRATATLADGRVAYLALVLAAGEWSPGGPAVFRRPRHLAVTVREEGRGPAQGAGVAVFDRSGRALAGPVLSDTEGRAEFATLPPVEVSVRVAADPDMIASARVGVLSGEAGVPVDLRQGDGTAELAVQARQVATIAVLDERDLPLADPYTLEVLLWPEALHWRSPAGVEFDPAGGSARFALRPPAKGHKVWVRASALGRATATTELPLTGEGTFGPATLRLDPGASLTVRLLPPSDGVCSVRLERLAPDAKWSAVELVPVRGFDDGFSHAFESLVPGSYRLHDAYCGAVSEPAELRPRASGFALALDLSRAGWVEGSLEVPEGVASDEVALVVTGRGLAFDDVAYADGDRIPRTVRGSAFRLRVPGDRDVLVAAQHPRCQPDPRNGVLRVVAPGSGHRLRLLLK
jgi:hypothetical protein